MIERKIIIAMITSTDFLQNVRPLLNYKLVKSQLFRLLIQWCIEYFDKFNKAPGNTIEQIYYQKLKRGMDESLAEEIEQDVLPKLSKEYLAEAMNIPYLIEQTELYFKEKRLLDFSETIKHLTEEGEIKEAEYKAMSFVPIQNEIGQDLDLGDEIQLKKAISNAFNTNLQQVLTYPKQLGRFLNDHLIREGFVALMAPEKRGKTFWLLDFAMRGVFQGRQVCFFQAGDMSEKAQLLRIGSYLSRKTLKEKNTGKKLEPVRDCIYNQLDNCDKEERECSFGIFPDRTERELRNEITFGELKEAFEDNPKYKPCCNCKAYQIKKIGTVWYKQIIVDLLDEKEAIQSAIDFFIKKKKKMKLSTYPNGSLTVEEIKNKLQLWEKKDGFIPDLIVIDYADLLVTKQKMEFRNQQNEIWKSLRGLSQEKHCLLITATQADAKSYDQDRLKLSNFSEDKRKYAHVTAMFGLNQDRRGREKKLGLMVLNELVLRESDFANSNEIKILQNLDRGAPFIGSYF